MQIICGNPDLMFTVNYLQKILFIIYTMSYFHSMTIYALFITKVALIWSDCPLCSKRCNYIKHGVLSERIQPNLVKKTNL